MSRTPVVLIHGAWLHVSSWDPWAARLTDLGFQVSAPPWPGESDTVSDARREPASPQELGLDALTEHYARIVRSFDDPPVLIGHSVGGLIAQHLIGANLGRAAVAIAPAPLNGVAPAYPPVGSWDDQGANDALVLPRSEQFREAFANAVTVEEATRIFERWIVGSPRRLLIDLDCKGTARHPRAVAAVGNTTRGPLLLISGQEDRMVPDSLTRSVFKLYGDSVAVSNLKQFADRGHSMVVDSGWPAVADYAVDWLASHGIHAELPDD